MASIIYNIKLKRKLAAFVFLMFTLPSSILAGGLFDKTYEWQGTNSAAWELNSNWNNNPGSEGDPQDYSVDGDEYTTAGEGGTDSDPEISASTTYGYTIENITVNDDAQLTISGSTLTILDLANSTLSCRDGSRVLITGGTINTVNLSVLDASSTVTMSGGTVNLNGSLAIGADPADPAGAGTGGSPTFTMSSGTLNCVDIVFDDEEGDTPLLILSGDAIVNVSGDVYTSNAGIGNISISGNAQLNITGDLIFDNAGASNDIVTMSGGELNLGGDWTNGGTNALTGGTVTFNHPTIRQVITSNTSPSGATFYNLEFDNGIRMNINTDFTVTNTFTIMNSIFVRVLGDWESQGTTSMSGVQVLFSGSVPQEITSSTSVTGATFDELQLNNSSGLTLNAPTTITSSFIFFSGIVTPSSSLTFADGASSTSSSTSYVNGAVTKIGTNTFQFPLSSQIRISSISASETFTAQYTSANGIPIYGSDKADGISHVSSLEHWVLNRATPGGASAVVRLQWNSGSDIGPDQAAWDKLLVCRWDGSEWVSHGGSANGTVPSGNVFSGIVTDFSPFTFGSTDASNPLPVELLFFDASINNEVVEIDWATAAEIDNEKFEIERSIDGETFEKIGEIEGKGDSNKRIDYSFDDISFSSVFSENVYYRLKQVDYDGEFEYSEIARVNKPLEKETLSVAPNPYSSSFDLKFVAQQTEKIAIRVLDMNGKIYYSSHYDTTKGPNSFTISDLYNIPVGLYLVNIQGPSISFTERILKRN